MQPSLEQELKQFEKELSLLLVRFMKICDQVEAAKAGPAVEAPKPPAAPKPPMAAKRPESSFAAYA
jgi:hypothetical protein